MLMAEKMAALARMNESMSTSVMEISRPVSDSAGGGEDIAAHAVLVVRDALALADELTLGGDDRRAVELGDDVDDAGAADADGLLSVRADDAERGLHGIAVDLDGFDRTVSRAHAAGDVAALKGRDRPSRRRTS